jgi:putative flippase GtrA
MQRKTFEIPDDIPPVVEKFINTKAIAPLANRIMASKRWGPPFRKLLSREILTYMFWGITTTIVNYAAFLIFEFIGMDVGWNNILSSTIAILFAFVVNKHFVFLSTDWHVSKFMPELVKFVGGRLAAMFVETFMLVILVDKLGLYAAICKMFTLLFVMAVNYIISKLIF